MEMLGVVIGITFTVVFIIGTVIATVWIHRSHQKSRKVELQRHNELTSKYATDTCGLFRLYDGSSLTQGEVYEVAYLNGDIIISAQGFEKRIPADDIVDIHREVIQEGYTKTTVVGFSGVGVALSAASAIGNAAKKAHARSDVLIITCRNEELMFFSRDISIPTFEPFDALKKDFKYKKDFDKYSDKSADNIVAAFASDRYNRK